ncbi:hypothetical protein LTR85_001149 [Meristemomyces frigidus]|nr:hypothetical protein LTR85_001149 [Meristemomyces frigidus]
MKDDAKAQAPYGQAAYIEFPARSSKFYYLSYAGEIALWGNRKPARCNHLNGYGNINNVRENANCPHMVIGEPRPTNNPGGYPLSNLPKVLFEWLNTQCDNCATYSDYSSA